ARLSLTNSSASLSYFPSPCGRRTPHTTGRQNVDRPCLRSRRGGLHVGVPMRELSRGLKEAAVKIPWPRYVLALVCALLLAGIWYSRDLIGFARSALAAVLLVLIAFTIEILYQRFLAPITKRRRNTGTSA